MFLPHYWLYSGMILSVIMPLYNEETTVVEIVEKVLALPLDLELIMIDNASADRTAELIEPYKDRDNVTVLTRPVNIGKGDAVAAAIPHASGKYTIIQDGDLEYDPNDIVHMVELAEQKKAEAVFGSRILNRQSGISYYRYLWGGKLLTFVANLLFGIGITDESTCYKMIRTDILKQLNISSQRFEFCPELVAKLARNKIKIYELPISYYPRKFEEGKKIRGIDGAEAIWTLLKYRLKPLADFRVEKDRQ